MGGSRASSALRCKYAGKDRKRNLRQPCGKFLGGLAVATILKLVGVATDVRPACFES